MQQNPFIDESLDSLAVVLAEQAGGGIRHFPAHVIFHSSRAAVSLPVLPLLILALTLSCIMCLSLFISFPPLSSPQIFSFLNFVSSYSSLSGLCYCKMMHSDAQHLNTIASTCSHRLKVRKASQAPFSLFPLADDSK